MRAKNCFSWSRWLKDCARTTILCQCNFPLVMTLTDFRFQKRRACQLTRRWVACISTALPLGTSTKLVRMEAWKLGRAFTRLVADTQIPSIYLNLWLVFLVLFWMYRLKFWVEDKRACEFICSRSTYLIWEGFVFRWSLRDGQVGDVFLRAIVLPLYWTDLERRR